MAGEVSPIKLYKDRHHAVTANQAFRVYVDGVQAGVLIQPAHEGRWEVLGGEKHPKAHRTRAQALRCLLRESRAPGAD